jgi:hypothetical protein
MWRPDLTLWQDIRFEGGSRFVDVGRRRNGGSLRSASTGCGLLSLFSLRTDS